MVGALTADRNLSGTVREPAQAPWGWAPTWNGGKDWEAGAYSPLTNLGSPITGFPITYAVGGRQFVAVSTGTGGTSSHFTALTPELRPNAGNNLFVFALPSPDTGTALAR